MYENKEIKKEIYQIIIPMILENILQISVSLITTAMVGRLMADAISAQGICVRITDTLWVCYKGVATGATILVAKAFGAGRRGECRSIIEQTMLTELIVVGVIQAVLFSRAVGKRDQRLRKIYFRELIRAGLIVSVVTSLLLLVFPGVFMKVMTDKAELQAIGVTYVFIMGFIQIPQNLSRVYNGTIRAMGHKNTPMLVAGFGIWIVRIPCCILAAYVLRLPIVSVWIIIAADQLSRFLLSAFLYRRIEKKETL